MSRKAAAAPVAVRAAGTKAVSLADLTSFVIGGCLLESEVANNGIHLALDPAKGSALLEAVDTNGMDWTPMPGTMQQVLLKARAHFHGSIASGPLS